MIKKDGNMNEQQMQFRVGLFVIVAIAAIGVMAFQFGEFRHFWEAPWPIIVDFKDAPGVHPATPVRMNGVRIGEVSEVKLMPDGSGVRVLLALEERYHLKADAKPRLVRSILGDTAIEFSPGHSRERLEPGAVVPGTSPQDPMETVARLEQRLSETVHAISATSEEWQVVGQNLNRLMDTNRGNLSTVIERTAVALDEFTSTMRTANATLASANSLISHPEHRKNLEKTLSALPEMVNETRATITAVRTAVGKVDQNLESLNAATAPLAGRSEAMSRKLDTALTDLGSAAAELKEFSQLLDDKDGSIQKLLSDPQLYSHLTQSAASLSVLLRNVDPIIRDMRVFSDKVARHPELFGLSGALNGSSGLKDEQSGTKIQQTSGSRIGRFPK